ncbi:helix-turn-helix domain-containing protein [Streptomyces sp. NPDC048277]|uniref:winged helix-turn-helix transcriptional regulator n=1 Tax=Streptomyces sp. NPDC048277 TaxID=3155027 RepID=UPI0033CBE464
MTTPHHPQPGHRSGHPRSTGTSPAITRTFALLSTHWNGLILMALAKGPADFAGMRERVPGISDRVLALRLRELTAIDLVTQDVLPGLSSRTRYALSPHGKAFLVPLAILFLWAEDHLPEGGGPDLPCPGDGHEPVP